MKLKKNKKKKEEGKRGRMVLRVGGENVERSKEEEGKKTIGRKVRRKERKNVLSAWKEEKRKDKNLSDVVGKWEREIFL